MASVSGLRTTILYRGKGRPMLVDTQRGSLLVGGQWKDVPRRVDVISPATEELIGWAGEATPVEIDEAVETAVRVREDRSWELLGMEARADCLDRVFETVRPALDDVAELVSAEMGLPITASRALNGDGVASMWKYVDGLGPLVCRARIAGHRIRISRDAPAGRRRCRHRSVERTVSPGGLQDALSAHGRMSSDLQACARDTALLVPAGGRNDRGRPSRGCGQHSSWGCGHR